MILISNYHEYRKEEFLLKVVSEDNEFYYCEHMPEDKDKFQDGYSIFALRKCLVGTDSLYCIYDKPIHQQLSLFDL